MLKIKFVAEKKNEAIEALIMQALTGFEDQLVWLADQTGLSAENIEHLEIDYLQATSGFKVYFNFVPLEPCEYIDYKVPEGTLEQMSDLMEDLGDQLVVYLGLKFHTYNKVGYGSHNEHGAAAVLLQIFAFKTLSDLLVYAMS